LVGDSPGTHEDPLLGGSASFCVKSRKRKADDPETGKLLFFSLRHEHQGLEHHCMSGLFPATSVNGFRGKPGNYLGFRTTRENRASSLLSDVNDTCNNEWVGRLPVSPPSFLSCYTKAPHCFSSWDERSSPCRFPTVPGLLRI
jgi:hypothetical protein